MTKNVKQSDVRRAQVLTRAALGASTRQIAKELDITEVSVSRMLCLKDSQEHLAEVIQSLNDQLNTRLPVLLTTALDKLEATLNKPYLDDNIKLRCIEVILRTATRLSELSVKSSSQINHQRSTRSMDGAAHE